MTFDELDQRMRVFETAHDHCVLPGIYMVARLDGHGFTRLTKEVHAFDAPFDERFRDHMIATTQALFDCGFRVIYGLAQSDEISLLFHPDENAFGRKLRKLCSLLAGEASAVFSLRLGARAVFDCRISQLPNLDLVVDYFRWRSADAHRNALTAHCYWALRKQGASVAQATQRIHKLSVAEKNELLFQEAGVNFNDVPAWHKRGVGVYWKRYDKPGRDPRTGAETRAERRQLAVDLELPMKDAYGDLVRALVAAA